MRRRGRATLILALAGACLWTPTAAPAGGGLTASTPPAQAALPSAPAAVELTFSATPLDGASHVSVLDGGGRTVNSAPASFLGRTLRQPVAAAGRGDYTVAYHVEFVEGGEATGSLRFSVGTGVPPGSPDEAMRLATADAIDTHQHSIDPFSAVLLVVDGIVVAGVIALLWLRRPPPRAGPDIGPPPS